MLGIHLACHTKDDTSTGPKRPRFSQCYSKSSSIHPTVSPDKQPFQNSVSCGQQEHFNITSSKADRQARLGVLEVTLFLKVSFKSDLFLKFDLRH